MEGRKETLVCRIHHMLRNEVDGPLALTASDVRRVNCRDNSIGLSRINKVRPRKCRSQFVHSVVGVAETINRFHPHCVFV
jgi:hypothetical protein